MGDEKKSLILCVDDDPLQLKLIEAFLSEDGHEIITARGGEEALELLQTARPDIILLDVVMRGLTGHQVCARLQENKELSKIPVIFLSGAEVEKNKALALSLGAVAFLSKPFQPQELKDAVRRHLRAKEEWERRDLCAEKPAAPRLQFSDFKKFLAARLNLTRENQERFDNITPGRMYDMAKSLGIPSSQVARYLAQFLGWSYLAAINPETVELGVLPISFCRTNQVLAIQDESSGNAIVLSNPFGADLMETINARASAGGEAPRLMIADPENISILLGQERQEREPQQLQFGASEKYSLQLANNILDNAVYRKASDIHVEPKGQSTVVRLRIQGDMQDVFAVKNETGQMIISRFKALAEMDVAERRKLQDGAMEVKIKDKTYVLRLSTGSTPHGESLVMRLLEPAASPKPPSELGMSSRQIQDLFDLAKRKQGLLLVTGVTGSGKTTTIYSLLNQIERQSRRLLTVEDPVEYRIPNSVQQQVNNKTGVTFEALLKASVRQDPDILFIGEIRDKVSARIAVDFASTGHLTISTMHTSNAATAIFRLERLDIARNVLSECVIGVVAQKLLKRVCPHCRQVGPFSEEDARRLGPFFMGDVPKEAAYPVGCVKCDDTGYSGREGVYEILRFYPEVAAMVRENAPITDIREFARRKGDTLMGQQALDKVRKLLFSPKDVYGVVISEEEDAAKPQAGTLAPPAPPAAPIAAGKRILIIENDGLSRTLMETILRNEGFQVAVARDGMEALSSIGKAGFDLIISDIRAPSMDGCRLLELLTSRGLAPPVVFLLAAPGDEEGIKSLATGPTGFMTRPIRKEALLTRVGEILKQRGP